MRVAAVGDLHVGTERARTERRALSELGACADVLLLAGDLTQHGQRAEARALAADLREAPVPVVAVLGNHDYHQGAEAGIRADLQEAGVTVLEGTGAVLELAGVRVGVAGVKGFGGGFAGACATEFGEPEMKAFIRHTKHTAAGLRASLERLDSELKIALLHYAPVESTLRGERLEIYPFLGSYLLAEAIDAAGCDLVLHGHAHLGAEQGVTAGGVPVRNVARPVLRRAYKVYRLHAPTAADHPLGRERVGGMLATDEPRSDDAGGCAGGAGPEHRGAR